MLWTLLRRHPNVANRACYSDTADVAFWHTAEVPLVCRDFRFRGHNEHQNRGCRLPLLTHNGLQRRLPIRSAGDPEGAFL